VFLINLQYTVFSLDCRPLRKKENWICTYLSNLPLVSY